MRANLVLSPVLFSRLGPDSCKLLPGYTTVAKKVRKRENMTVHKGWHKDRSFGKADFFLLNLGKFMGPITYLMRQFGDGERYITVALSA